MHYTGLGDVPLDAVEHEPAVRGHEYHVFERERERGGEASPRLAAVALELQLLPDRAHGELALQRVACEEGEQEPVRGRLRLIQAGSQAMTDIPAPYPSMINIASVQDLSQRTGLELDPVRFRGNLLIDGLEPWAELDMVGERLAVGEIEIEVRARIRRCVATSINPVTAAKDADLPKALFDNFGHMDCGVYVSVEHGGAIRPGDKVSRK